jgi:hypothetical protein
MHANIAAMAAGSGPGAVLKFRIGGEQHGFVYSSLPENAQLYQCERSTEPEPPGYRLYLFRNGGAWYAIEGPGRLPDGTHPTEHDLWNRGIWRWMCRHTVTRNGMHHWMKLDQRTKEVEAGQDAYLRTTVITHVPGPYPGFQDSDLVDQMAPNSDTEDERKGKGKGRYGGGWSSGGWSSGKGGKGGKY